MDERRTAIPYRIEVEDGPVVRCWDPRDAPLLKDAVDSSLEHLRRGCRGPTTSRRRSTQKAALLRRFRGQFDLGQDFVFGIFAADESEVLGGTGLHTRAGDGGLEIGYWVRADRTRRGIATSVAGGADEGGDRARRRRPHRDPGRGRQRAERHDRRGGSAFARRAFCGGGFRPQAAGSAATRSSSRCSPRSSPARLQRASASRRSTAAAFRSPSRLPPPARPRGGRRSSRCRLRPRGGGHPRAPRPARSAPRSPRRPHRTGRSCSRPRAP